MNYSKIDKNDITNGVGVCVSLWVSGCGHRCFNCHNSEIWDFNCGKPFTNETLREVAAALTENGVKRNLSILGGEPLAPQNIETVYEILREIKRAYPEVIAFLWTGYTVEELAARYKKTREKALAVIGLYIDYLIDGPYIESCRNITLLLRGSENQRIFRCSNFGQEDITESVDNKTYDWSQPSLHKNLKK